MSCHSCALMSFPRRRESRVQGPIIPSHSSVILAKAGIQREQTGYASFTKRDAWGSRNQHEFVPHRDSAKTRLA